MQYLYIANYNMLFMGYKINTEYFLDNACAFHILQRNPIGLVKYSNLAAWICV